MWRVMSHITCCGDMSRLFNVTRMLRLTDGAGLFAQEATLEFTYNVIAEFSYSSVCGLSYAINFRSARVSHTLVYVHGFRMLQNFVLSAKSTKNTKLNCVQNLCGYSSFFWSCQQKYNASVLKKKCQGLES